MGFASMKDLLGGKRGGDTGARRHIAAAHVVHVANTILVNYLPEGAHKHACVASFVSGAVTIHVKNGIVRSHLKSREKEFLADVRATMPDYVVTYCRYRIVLNPSL